MGRIRSTVRLCGRWEKLFESYRIYLKIITANSKLELSNPGTDTPLKTGGDKENKSKQ